MNKIDVLDLATNSKKFNVMRIIHLLRDHENVSIADIAGYTQIPTQTVYRIVRSLITSGVILQTAQQQSVLGRKATLYSINPKGGYLLGVFMDKTAMNIFISDLSGNIQNNHYYTYDDTKTTPEILDMIDGGIKRAVSELKVGEREAKRIAVMGFTVMASIDTKEREIIKFNNLQCMNGFHLVKYMEEKYGIRTILMKNSFIESSSSLIRLAKQGIDNFVELHLGVGIGTAVIINGKQYLGANGNVGELVNVRNEMNQPIETCSNTGVLYERFLNYVKQQNDQELSDRLERSLSLFSDKYEKAMIKTIDDEIGGKNKDVVAMVSEFISAWGKIIYNLIVYYDPQAIVVNGDLSEGTPHIINMLQKYIKKSLQTKTKIIPASAEDTKEMSMIANIVDTAYSEIIKNA
jgi:N-acetylglucosamine repressor